MEGGGRIVEGKRRGRGGGRGVFSDMLHMKFTLFIVMQTYIGV